jgi:hypothetical protein
MVYDPGAGITTISEQAALNAGYRIQQTGNISSNVVGIGGIVRAKHTVIPDLIMGGVSLGPVFAHVVKFSDNLADRTSALLGMNVLSWFKITQDCHWDDKQEKFATATIMLEPKFDISSVPSLDKFSANDRKQRFGNTFLIDNISLHETHGGSW